MKPDYVEMLKEHIMNGLVTTELKSLSEYTKELSERNDQDRVLIQDAYEQVRRELVLP